MSIEPDEPLGELRLDRTRLSVARLTDPDDAVEHWLSRLMEERLRALEFLRRTFYDHTGAGERLQRAFEVIKLEQR